jgi:hypothetical protein
MLITKTITTSCVNAKNHTQQPDDFSIYIVKDFLELTHTHTHLYGWVENAKLINVYAD